LAPEGDLERWEPTARALPQCVADSRLQNPAVNQAIRCGGTCKTLIFLYNIILVLFILNTGVDMMRLRVGDRAPDFALRSHLDQEIRLRDLRGQNVVLVFYPMAWTPV
jgi:hypothetical protein